MKKIIALAVALNTTTAFAFFNDGATNGAFVNDGRGEVVGNGNAEGEATFSMTFSGKGRTAGDFKGNGYNNSSMNAYGEQRDVYRPPYYGNPQYNFPAQEK